MKLFRRSGGVVRTPVVMQMEAIECGAAALAIMLAYYGRHEPLDQLRVACGVGRDGAKLSNLLKAARGFGLEAAVWSTRASELPKLDGPYVVLWNFKHLLVVEGFDSEGQVHLNDPASGRRRVSRAEFEAAFSGVLLTMRPGPDFRKRKAGAGLLPAMLARLATDRPALAFASLAGLFLVIPGMVIPVFTRMFVDRILIDNQQSWFLPILFGLALATALEAGLLWLQGAQLAKLQTKLALAASGRFLWHVLHLPLPYFAQRAANEVAARLKLNESVAKVVTGDLARALINGGLALFFVAVMLTYDALLTAISVAVVVLSLLAFQFAARRTRELSVSYALADGRLQGNAANGIAMIETLAASADDSYFFSKYMAQHAQLVKANQRMESTSSRYAVVPAFLMMLAGVLILVIGGLRVMDGYLTIGMLIAFQGLVLNFARPMSDLFSALEKVQRLHGHLQRLDDVLDCDSDTLVAPPTGTPDLSSKLSGALELRALQFAYSPADAPLIAGLDLQLLPGERLGIVGASGSGKSTLARLMAGMYAPTAGQVLLDGRPRSDYPREYLAASVAHVDQEIQFFEGSLRDNLSLWDPSLDEAQLVAAARDAQIHDFILSLPKAYDSKMDENGRNLSGGQRQRLEIARALAVAPRLLILDEATSSLEAGLETAILDACRRRGCSTVLITHRRFALAQCDRVLVLEQGRIVDQGDFAALMARPDSPCRRILEGT